MMTTLNKVGMPATKDLIVAACVDASFMCMVPLRLDQHQVLFRMVKVTGKGIGAIGAGSQEGKTSGWTWIDTENLPRSKVEGKVVTNTAS